MSWRVVAVLAGVGLLLTAAAWYLVRVVYLRFELYYDRPKGEPEVFRFQVWLPPFLHLTAQPRPAEDASASAPQLDWSQVLAKGWSSVREIRSVQESLAALFRHDLGFLKRDRSLKRRARWLLALLERVRWQTEELHWVTRVGAGDAALTGMLCGLLWGAKGVVFGLLAERMAFTARPHVMVQPDFESVAFRTTFRCILRVRLRDIIRAGLGLSGKRGASWSTNTRLRA